MQCIRRYAEPKGFPPKENADIIDDSDVHIPLDVLERDIRSYVQAQQLLDQIGANYHVPVDYIKSTPYLMSFMRDYQLKRNVEQYFKKNPQELKKIKKDTFGLIEMRLTGMTESQAITPDWNAF